MVLGAPLSVFCRDFRAAGCSIRLEITLALLTDRRESRCLDRCRHRLAAGADPVRLHDQLSFHLSVLLDRARLLSRRARGTLAEDRARSLSQPVPLLAEDLRRGLRDGLRLR